MVNICVINMPVDNDNHTFACWTPCQSMGLRGIYSYSYIWFFGRIYVGFQWLILRWLLRRLVYYWQTFEAEQRIDHVDSNVFLTFSKSDAITRVGICQGNAKSTSHHNNTQYAESAHFIAKIQPTQFSMRIWVASGISHKIMLSIDGYLQRHLNVSMYLMF